MERAHYQLLIADDDADFRQALCDIFAPFFHLIEVESGEEAVELVARQEIHLALFDMHMKQLTGLDALRQLRARQIVAPCIIITADYTDSLRDDAQQAEAFSVLKKPINRRVLVSTVANAVEMTYADSEFGQRMLCG